MQNLKINSEDELLQPEIRARIIQEIGEGENERRRNESFKRYEVLKDQTDIWVRSLLEQWFDGQTVNEMMFARTNISFGRKIVDKLARSYNHGVTRMIGNEKTKTKQKTKALEQWSRELMMNRSMKKCDKYLRMFKNTVVYAKPNKVIENGEEKFELAQQVLAPYLYDVIEEPNNREKPMAFILSPFAPNRQTVFSLSPSTEGRTPTVTGTHRASEPRRGDGLDQSIADHPADQDLKGMGNEQREYVWWTKNWHFTTDSKGKIIGGRMDENGEIDITNPIQELPFVNFAEDQDGAFWAIGGDDIVDSSIKLNCLFTHTSFTAVLQGYGQLVITGSKGTLKKSYKVGPTQAFTFEYEKETQDKPEAKFINANAPIDQLVKLMETWVALVLSTNNLSTKGFSANLQGTDFPSGLAIILDQAESNEDIQEQQEIFSDLEPDVFALHKKWYDVFKEQNVLSEDQSELPEFPDVSDMTTSFGTPEAIVSETEKLNNLKLRKELGIDGMIDIIMKDDPSLDQEQAEEKLKRIIEEKMQRMARVITNGGGPNGQNNQSPRNGQPDQQPPGLEPEGDPESENQGEDQE